MMTEDCIYATSLTKIEDITKDFINFQEEYPFFICNIDDFIKKYKLWIELFPRIVPHYAVKCNNHKILLRVMAALGFHFDCASRVEIEQILSIGVHPSKIIFAHTCKSISHIKYAAEKNVDLMTFDSKEELYKIKHHFPNARAVLRIKYDDPNAVVIFGHKFGCDPYIEAEELLKIAIQQKINVVGVSFHIGFGSKNGTVFYDAIKAARYVFNISEKLGHTLHLLDIGGGYPGKNNDLILSFAKYINKGINEYFSDLSIRIISEPGTFFVESAFTLTCCILSVKEKFCKDLSPYYHYYINEGVFGNLSKKLRNVKFLPRPIKESTEDVLYSSTVWGPTCDTTDKVADNILLPKMDVGDWFIIDNAGNYTNVLSTSFNGFGSTLFYNIISHENMLLLKSTSSFKYCDSNNKNNKDSLIFKFLLKKTLVLFTNTLHFR